MRSPGVCSADRAIDPLRETGHSQPHVTLGAAPSDLAVLLKELPNESANFARRRGIHPLAERHELVALFLLEAQNELTVLLALLVVLLSQVFPIGLDIFTCVYTYDIVTLHKSSAVDNRKER